MNKYVNIIIIFLFLIFNLTYSQKSYPKQSIGLGYSLYSGSGILYEYQFNPNYALKFTGLVYYYGDDPPDVLDLFAISGLEFQRNIYKDYNKRIYFLASCSYWYFEERTKVVERINDNLIITKNVDINDILNLGIGIGLDYKLLESLSLSIDIGLLYQKTPQTDFSKFIDRDPSGKNYFGYGFGLSFKYNF